MYIIIILLWKQVLHTCMLTSKWLNIILLSLKIKLVRMEYSYIGNDTRHYENCGFPIEDILVDKRQTTFSLTIL